MTHIPTPHEAETAGMMAAMTTGASRKVPAEYADGGRLEAAYTYGFNATIQATQSYEIDTTPRKVRKPVEPKQAKPVPKQARKAPPPPVKQAPPSMMAILDSQHIDAA
jgi:hypothetical protein